MTEQEMLNIIETGEDSFTEFKSAQAHNDSIAKEIVAFANMEGGSIFIGIEDNKEVTGCDQKGIEERIVNVCRNNIAPPINPIMKNVKFKELDIIQISIRKGLNKPYKVKSNNNFYIRVGSVSIEPSNEELVRLFQESGSVHYEIQPIDTATIDDIELLKFKNYCERIKIFDSELDLHVLLKNLKIIDAIKKPTLLGLLFFGKNIQFIIPQAGLEMFCYSGIEKDTNILDHKSEVLSIPELIEIGERFVKYNSATKAVFNSNETRREDIQEYPDFVIRELLANAFAHRDWSIFGQRVRIEIFSDRLEIFSPGKLPNTLELESAMSGVSFYRNPIISQILKDYSLVEKSGRGLLKIMNFYKRNRYLLPKIELTNSYLKVILYSIN